MLDELGARGELDWTSEARKVGPLTELNPVDHGSSGSKLHVLSEIPLVVGVSGANPHDSLPSGPW